MRTDRSADCRHSSGGSPHSQTERVHAPRELVRRPVTSACEIAEEHRMRKASSDPRHAGHLAQHVSETSRGCRDGQFGSTFCHRRARRRRTSCSARIAPARVGDGRHSELPSAREIACVERSVDLARAATAEPAGATPRPRYARCCLLLSPHRPPTRPRRRRRPSSTCATCEHRTTLTLTSDPRRGHQTAVAPSGRPFLLLPLAAARRSRASHARHAR